MSQKDLQQYYPGLAESCRRAYHRHIDGLRDVAKAHGYALGVHGSLNRDIDLIAAPWDYNATDPQSLILALCENAKELDPHGLGFLSPRDSNPTKKPLGRLAWSIHVSNGVYFDVSVMPKRPDDFE